MSQVPWKILPWHRSLNKLKSLRPDYKSEFGVFSNGSTVLELRDAKQGLGTDSLLPLGTYMFVFSLEIAYWSHKNVTPEEVSPPCAATASCWTRCCLSCPSQHHVGVKPEVGANTATGARANPAHAAASSACPCSRLRWWSPPSPSPVVRNRSPARSRDPKPCSREG